MKILEAIQDPNSELALLLDSLYDAVYIVDRERVILYWNHAAEQITGFSAAEVLGHSCKDGILNHIDENGKPAERRRRKALGSKGRQTAYDSQLRFLNERRGSTWYRHSNSSWQNNCYFFKNTG
jgi:PAS domain S-box-containing protein